MKRNQEFLEAILILNFVLGSLLALYAIKKNNKLKIQWRKNAFFVNIIKLLFIEYLICLCCITVIPLPFSKTGIPCLNLDPFHQTYNNLKSALNHTSNRTIYSELENIFGNMVIFFPLGFFLPIIYTHLQFFLKVFAIAFLVSFSIEALQYYISVNWGYNRIADIDDLILNTLGASLGFVCYKLCVKIENKRVGGLFK